MRTCQLDDIDLGARAYRDTTGALVITTRPTCRNCGWRTSIITTGRAQDAERAAHHHINETRREGTYRHGRRSR